MACFLVPATEAIITTIVARVVRKREASESTSDLASRSEEAKSRIKLSTKLGWLNKLLWGGALLLAYEHVWHGEVVPYFPFLTAVAEGDTMGMLAEMGTAGVGMAVLVTAVWGVMVWAVSSLEKRDQKILDTAVEGA